MMWKPRKAVRMKSYPKEIFKLFLILSILFLYESSCSDKDFKIEADFYYINNSAFDIVIRRYNAEQGTTMSLVEEIEIASNEEFLINVNSEGSENVACETFRPVIESDSLSIEYSNRVIKSFKQVDNSNDNPLLISNYATRKIGANHCEFKFTIE
jgi:hypothetical protein